ncbi:uncharacterized protein [Aegilops tauschii subsp. strangulata]
MLPIVLLSALPRAPQELISSCVCTLKRRNYCFLLEKAWCLVGVCVVPTSAFSIKTSRKREVISRYFTTSPNMHPPTCSALSTTSSCESFCSRSSSSMVLARRDDQFDFLAHCLVHVCGINQPSKGERASTSSDVPWLLLPPSTTRCSGGRRRRAERRQQPPLPRPAPPHRVTISLAALHLDVEHFPPMRDQTDKALLPPSSPWIQVLFPVDSRRHEVTSGTAGGVKAVK